MTRNFLRQSLGILLGSLILCSASYAQDKPEDSAAPQEKTTKKSGDYRVYEEQFKTTDCSKMPNRSVAYDCAQAHMQWRIIPIRNAMSQNDQNEILVAVRNLFDPGIKVFLSTSQSTLAVSSYPQELDRIESFIRATDLPHPTYRVTFTLAESDAGKRIGVQHYTVVAVAGQRSTTKQGSKIPVATGSYKEAGGGMQQQFTYLDIGMNIDLTLTPSSTGLQMKAKVEQSSVSEESVIAGVHEPVVRQTVFEGYTSVTPGKPQAIGQLDLPGSTRHVDIDVLIEALP